MDKSYNQIVSLLDDKLDKPTFLKVQFTGWERCEKGHNYGPAVRNHYLMHFVVKGKGVFSKYGKSYQLYPGNGFLIVPDEITTYTADLHNPWEYYWVGFVGAEAENLLSQFGISAENPVFSFNLKAMEQPLAELIQNKPHPGSDFLMLSALFKLFANLAVKPSGQNSELDAAYYVSRATEFIDTNYAYELTVEKISNYIGIHRSYLYKLFMNQLGISVQQYLINRRLAEACKLLKRSSYTISQVCYSCGFQDPDHFSKLFKQKMKVSPTRYRQS